MKYFSLLICCLAAYSATAQPASDPCCRVIGINPATNAATVVNNITGQLFMFRASPADIQAMNINDAITTNGSYTYVTAINISQRQYFVGPLNFLQKTDNTAKGLVNINFGNPCCILVNIGNPVIVQNTISGNIFALPIPQELSSALKTGDRIYTTTIKNDNFGIIQTYASNTGAPSVFVFPVNNEFRTAITAESWEIYAVDGLKEGLGRLNTDFPDGVEWGIDIYTAPGQKLIRNRLIRDKQLFYPMKPGNYSFKLNLINVPSVPVEAGKETRLKAGYLNIKTGGIWNIYNETKTKLYISNSQPKKLALPAGKYQLKLGGNFSPIEIRDGETIGY